MPEVKVTNEQAAAKREPPPPAGVDEFFTPMFPVGRFFGRRPFALWRALTDEMDRAFSGTVAQQKEDFWTPVVEVRKCNGDLVVTAELPGLQKDDVKVEMTDDALVIKGERRTEHKEDHEGYHRTERSYGRFYRSIPLPEGAKTGQVKAELTNGVLKVSIPAPEAKKLPRQVPVETGAANKAAA